ncbi:MAG TPA: phosphotransferase [Thermoanaerobaculia bacterium]|nr:phosphotransferase [Thermoanaerobaculia bacterium]
MYGELDRFLVPLHEPEARRYFTQSLYVPQGPAGRLRRATGRPQLKRASSTQGIEHVLSMLDEVPDLITNESAIYLRDYETSERGRTIAFFHPAMVVKTQRAGAAPSLRVESEAIEQMGAFLPPDLKKTLPAVLRYHTSPRGELLAMTALPGRSAYIDMQGSLAPWKYVEEHFDAAAKWLAAFHLATRTSDTSIVKGKEIPHSAMHGDFWPRNVLLSDDGAVGVVDWEHFTHSASPLTDVLHYATTYGINYPWRRYQRVDEKEALRRTFREKNRVSRAVRAYFETYSKLTGITVAMPAA